MNKKITTTKIAIFKKKEIRKIIHNNEWWFSVADVVEALTDSTDTRQYIKRMRQRDPEINSYWGTICTPLKMMAKDWLEHCIFIPLNIFGRIAQSRQIQNFQFCNLSRILDFLSKLKFGENRDWLERTVHPVRF